MTSTAPIVAIAAITLALVLVITTAYVRRSSPGWTPPLTVVLLLVGALVVSGLALSMIGLLALPLLLTVPLAAAIYAAAIVSGRSPADRRGPAEQPWFWIIVLLGNTIAVIALLIVALSGHS
jgi:hypothetical protein